MVRLTHVVCLSQLDCGENTRSCKRSVLQTAIVPARNERVLLAHRSPTIGTSAACTLCNTIVAELTR